MQIFRNTSMSFPESFPKIKGLSHCPVLEASLKGFVSKESLQYIKLGAQTRSVSPELVFVARFT